MNIRWSAMNPLRLENRGLPPALVMAARIMAAALVLRGDSTFRIHLPYLEVLDGLMPPDVFNMALRLVADAGYLLILFSPFVRTGAGLTGAAYLAGLVACRPCHSVAHTYVGCLLVIIALSSRATGTRLVRAQAVLLYAGAALNKSLDPDWWNGRYFDTFLIAHHQNALFIQAASWLPAGWLSAGMGIATVVTQWVLAWAFLAARRAPVAIAVGLLFHGAMVLLLNMTFGPFLLALFATYVGLAPWPDAPVRRPQAGAGWADWTSWLWREPAALFVMTALIASAAWNGWLRNATLLVASASLMPLARSALARTAHQPHAGRPEERAPCEAEPLAGREG